MNINLEEALDEFDSRYLESYHQVTAKMASSVLAPAPGPGPVSAPGSTPDSPSPPLRLSSPLLASRDSDDNYLLSSIVPLAQPPLMGPPRAPPRQISTRDRDREVRRPSQDDIKRQHVKTNLIQKSPTDIKMGSPEARLRKVPGSASAPVSPATSELQWGLSVDIAGRQLSVLVDVPRGRIQRSLSASSLVHKTSSRRGRDRRNSSATYVGNPFYKKTSKRELRSERSEL
ncbi:hypothetical protein FT663_04722 [Candidozyma haemuli var. vulneris]|uniref:Uncharacterized protein n=1 Tax=Candidozyma haemuli TaxID=45357 RepID=A0A2V1APL9_9ASCO|nr:hypothetical protein CXQ85_001970 [[Candida] haemuloni]KAF3985600.1 hypothetical protein FT662_05062 [[Candida] haemuloni var. vulneris]KAF3986778.1 hypothetical protein FT663_04722 [[Candida] haemuloni var. vulneris]PVH20187.1 hypothetical protein CXQ85_001970 [[Candida] haemuloni]